MSAITDFFNRAAGKPSDREAFLAKTVENLGLKPDELFETKDDQAAKKIFDVAIATATSEANEKLATTVADHTGRIVSVEAAFKAAGLDLKFDALDKLADTINAKIKTEASKEALAITASRGIQPVNTSKAAVADGTTSETSNLKGREKVIAAFETEFKGKSKSN